MRWVSQYDGTKLIYVRPIMLNYQGIILGPLHEASFLIQIYLYSIVIGWCQDDDFQGMALILIMGFVLYPNYVLLIGDNTLMI